jgi:hypothetical protein
MAEFDLATLAVGPATASFTYLTASIFRDPSRPLTGQLFVDTYAGDNQASLLDYGQPSTGSLGSFTLESHAFGDTISFDVTSILAAAIGRGDAALGMRLRPSFSSFADTSASFGDFTLTVAAVPEPSTYALFMVGFSATALALRRRRARVDRKPA